MVEPVLMDTSVIWTPFFYGQVLLLQFDFTYFIYKWTLMHVDTSLMWTVDTNLFSQACPQAIHVDTSMHALVQTILALAL